jgi:hypothetical protein
MDKNHEIYQVFSESDNNQLVVDNLNTYDEAVAVYNDKQGFLLLGIDAPTAFNVILAKPYGISLIS